MIKKFESFSNDGNIPGDWKSEFLNVYDYFCELDDKYKSNKILDIDYKAGYVANNVPNITSSINDVGEIVGGDNMQYCLNNMSEFFIKIEISTDKNERSLFKIGNNDISFSKKDSELLIEVISYVNKLKDRLNKYELDITFRDNPRFGNRIIIINLLYKIQKPS